MQTRRKFQHIIFVILTGTVRAATRAVLLQNSQFVGTTHALALQTGSHMMLYEYLMHTSFSEPS